MDSLAYPDAPWPGPAEGTATGARFVGDFAPDGRPINLRAGTGLLRSRPCCLADRSAPTLSPSFARLKERAGRLLASPGQRGSATGKVWPSLAFSVMGLWLATSPLRAWAQVSPPSRDYLFATNVDDARAVWVNPAGLAWVPEASVAAEAVLDRVDGSVHLGQYSFGLNSRGLALAYWRDRPAEAPRQTVLTVGLAVPLGLGSVGASMSSYRGRRDTGYDIGLRYPAPGGASVGLLLRNLGRPVMDSFPQPVTGVAGITLPVAPGLAAVSLEGTAAERLASSGYDLGYRAGFVVQVGGTLPLALHAVVRVAGGEVRQWSLGLLLGRLDRVGVVGSALPASGLGQPRRFSAVGVASRRPRAEPP